MKKIAIFTMLLFLMCAPWAWGQNANNNPANQPCDPKDYQQFFDAFAELDLNGQLNYAAFPLSVKEIDCGEEDGSVVKTYNNIKEFLVDNKEPFIDSKAVVAKKTLEYKSEKLIFTQEVAQISPDEVHVVISLGEEESGTWGAAYVFKHQNGCWVFVEIQSFSC